MNDHSPGDPFESILLDFDQAWHDRSAADLGKFAQRVAPDQRAALLSELIKIDLEYRWKSGEHRLIEEYFVEFPQLGERLDIPLELIEEEILCRQRFSIAPSLSELQKRFPVHGSHFESLLQRPSETAKKKESTKKSLSMLISEQSATGVESLAEPSQKLIANRFELKDKLGQGAFANVFRAWDRHLQRPVAVKIARGALSSDEPMAQRFLREAQSAARLEHPGIVSIHEVGQENEHYYMVQELIQGGTLNDLLNDDPIDASQSARLTLDICRTLDYAHQCGIVHRDIKPTNIMIDRAGRPRIADFGLAMQADAAITLTHEGDLLGTPAYMSPEQARSDHKNVGPTSDIYSTGVMLYQLLCGRLPFVGDPISVIASVVEDDPVAPRRIRAKVPIDLQTICLKAMDKDPQRRYSSAGAMADDLHRWLNNEPISARPIGALEVAWKWCKRRPALAATVTGFTALLVSLSIASYIGIANERDKFRGQRDVAKIERDRANQTLFEALTQNVENTIRNRGSGWYQEALDTIDTAAELELADRDPTRLRELAVELVTDRSIRFTLDRVWQPVSNGAIPVSMAFDHEGRYAIVGFNDGRARLIRPDQPGFEIWLTGPSESAIYNPAFSIDRRCAFAWSDKAIWRWDLPADPARLPSTTALKGQEFVSEPCSAFAFSNDQKRMAVGFPDGEIVVYQYDERGLQGRIARLVKHESGVSSVAFSPNGRLLVSGSDDKSCVIWDVDQEHVIDEIKNEDPISQVAFDHTGTSILFVDHPSFSFTTKPIGGSSVRHRPFANSVWHASFLPSGQIVSGSIDGSLKLWSGEQVIGEVSGLGEVYCVATSPDGQAIMAGYQTGAIRKWDLTRNEIARHFHTDHAFSIDNHNQIYSDHGIYKIDQGMQSWLSAYDAMRITSIAGLHKSNVVVAGTDRGHVLWHDLKSKQTTENLNAHQEAVLAVSVLADERLLVTVDQTGNAIIWDTTSRRVVRQFEFDVGHVHCVSAMSTGRRLACTGTLGIAAIDFDDWDHPESLLEQYQADSCIEFLADALAISRPQGEIEIRDVDGQQIQRTLKGHRQSVIAMAYDQKSNRLISSSQDGQLVKWDLSSGDQIKSVNTQWPVTAISIDPQSKVFACHFRSAHYLFDLEEMLPLVIMYSYGAAPAVAFSHDGKYLWTGSRGLWQRNRYVINREVSRARQTGQLSRSTIGQAKTLINGHHVSQVWGVAHSPDRNWVATTCHDGFVKIWNTHTRRLVETLVGHDPVVWHAAFNRDSTVLASGGVAEKQGEIILWDTKTWKKQHRVAVARRLISCLDFHPTQPWLVAGSMDGSIHFIEVNSGTVLSKAYQSRQSINDVRFSPDGSHLISAGGSNGVQIWQIVVNDENNPRLSDVPRVLKQPGEKYWTACFSNDGRQIATATESGIVCVYNFDQDIPSLRISSELSMIRRIQFGGEDRFLACSAYRHGGIVWDLHKLQEQLASMNLAL